jgi:glycine/D-amino acid oxidase-like deaminating enzyme
VDADVVIVGAGLSGAAAAWSLTRRGRSVVVLEQFTPGHDRGSSHGSARIVRRGYGDALYVRLTGEAFELWREVEQSSGRSLLRMLGGIDFGAARNVASMAELFIAADVPHTVLPAAEAEACWPGMLFEGDVLFHPQAGTLDPDGAISAFVALASAAGADVRYSSPAVSVSSSGTVGLASGETVSAPVVVVAAGAWLSSLASSVLTLPPLHVKEQTIFHFPRLDPQQPLWPSVIHEMPTTAVYHLAGGRDGGPADDRKLGDHFGGVLCDPSARAGEPVPVGALQDYVSRWLPGLSSTPSSTATCLYTLTPSEDFILDRVGPLVVCSPCSGHGAKFAPLAGELVADLVCGTRGSVPERFSLAAHLSGPPGAVSL